MKPLHLLAIALLTLTSCSKQDDPKPTTSQVRYNVTCESCLIYVEDNTWNQSNKPQHFNVSGNWKYAFVPQPALDSVTLRVVTFSEQAVTAQIFYGTKAAGFGKIINGERTITLKLK